MYVANSDRTCPNVGQIAFATQERTLNTTLKAGSNVFFEGDDVTCIYVIESGVLRLTRVLEDGRRQVIAFGYPGDVVGFPAQGVHHTDCDALTDARLHPIPRRYLDDIRIDAEMHGALMDAALREISAMQDHFMMLGRKTAAEKVASFLSVLLDRLGAGQAGSVIELPMKRSDIADFLGLTTETVSRCFTALRKAGVIRLSGAAKVEVLAPALLEQRASGQLN